MDFSVGVAAETLRTEVQAFLSTEYPGDLLDKVRRGTVLHRDDHVRSQRALHARGWLAPSWPVEHGGPDWTAAQRYVFEQEMERAGALPLIPMGIIYVGPIISRFGSAEQQQRWLPDILESRALWAQGYSEPEAGSDLAGLSMRAEREGDSYLVNGTKIWTTQAHWADWIFCLVRTSREDRKQAGISFLCIAMNDPGVMVHPVMTLDGVHHLNRVEFRDVRVPADQRIGDEGEGWRYANQLLQSERISYAHVARKRADLASLKRWAKRLGLLPSKGGRAAAAFAESQIAVDILEMDVLRLLAMGESASLQHAARVKIRATKIAQQISELGLALAGPAGGTFERRDQADWHDRLAAVDSEAIIWTANYLFERAGSIYGGTTEVQKNIIWRYLAKNM